MWIEAGAAEFNVTFQNLPGGAEKDHGGSLMIVCAPTEMEAHPLALRTDSVVSVVTNPLERSRILCEF
jgi:hypothetical protein